MVEYLADKKAFDDAIAASTDKLLVIDFTATWCPPCKMIAPKFEEMAGENTDVTFKKIDVDANSEAAQAAGIQCMPTFKFYKGGAEITDAKVEGASEAKIRESIAAHKWNLLKSQ